MDRLDPIWQSRYYSYKTKAVICKALVLTVLLYGAESWPLTEAKTKKLEVFHTKALRRALDIRRRGLHLISNDELFQRADTESIAVTLRLL